MSSRPDPLARERRLTLDLTSACGERAKAEAEIDALADAKLREFETRRRDLARELQSRYEGDVAAVDAEYNQQLESVESRYQTTRAATEAEYAKVKADAERRYDNEKERARKRAKDAEWEARTIADSELKGTKDDFVAFRAEVFQEGERLATVRSSLIRYLRDAQRLAMFKDLTVVEPAPELADADDAAEPIDDLSLAEIELDADIDRPKPPPEPETNPLVWVRQKISEAEEDWAKASRVRLPLLAKADVLAWPFVVLGLAAAGYGAYVVQQQGSKDLTMLAIGLLAGPLAVAVVAVPICLWLVGIGNRLAKKHLGPILSSLRDAEALRRQTFEGRRERFRTHRNAILKTRRKELLLAQKRYDKRKAEVRAEWLAAKRAAGEKYPWQLSELERLYEQQKANADTVFPQRLADLKAVFDREAARLAAERQAGKDRLKAERDAAWSNALAKWKAAIASAQAEVATLNEECKVFAAWDDPSWATREFPTEFSKAVKFGTIELRMDKLPGGVPTTPAMKAVGPSGFTLPALVEFPAKTSMVFRAPAKERQQANAAIQAVMLRLLTANPPGKVRFTIIDPVGLGQDFSAFMHLADHDELLVNNRIWTEPQQIEQRLADLTQHMETVIQKYLRNEFETIEAYNEEAGEVAEPFRYVVVANFPEKFGETAARRLISILSSGPKCGVHALISCDPKQAQNLPHGMTWADYEQHATAVTWAAPKDQPARWIWKDPTFERFPLTLETPADPAMMTPLLHELGRRAKEASRVQVPFEVVAPKPQDYWKGDSSKGVAVALGRAGATKLQYYRVGQGTSQHALIAGRTGSGKSTLLHAMITNLALTYNPQEVELYLIDFKKGVEFKTYAQHELPHARVIAIESEREFGLSVMQRLDVEMRVRGDMYRELNAQDVAGYRQAVAELEPAARAKYPPLPRLLFIVDEFQEFFTEDDRISQEASLLLDRLVRQGRAFGIHVTLGSQTLGGAYSLARSTLGQMAIRVALQCSENDANLILSEENSAARLLTRPGEAIYNDQNGMVEGNSPFQVVWLDEDKREQYLDRVRELAAERGMLPTTPAIVFEGNIPADLVKSAPLNAVLAERPTTAPKVLRAWMGDAIAIKDPTCVEFRAESGANMLVLGQQPDAVRGLMAAALVGLAAQARAAGESPLPLAWVLDGTPADAVDADFFANAGRCVGGALRVAGLREVPTALQAFADELARRQADPDALHPSRFLVVVELARFRALRRNEDDFGFNRDDKPDPAKQFVNLVKEGPALGLHVVVCCDTLNNLNRAFDRSTLREFDARVLFQMSVNDSSALIDSPAASKLGANRALCCSEEQGRMEKFRPFGPPPAEWWDMVRATFAAG